MRKLRQTVAALRAPDGCPWDREQTPQSLCRCLIDEVSELLDTIDRGDWEHMREELGDVLLQVVMQAQIADEEGYFSFDDVAADIDAKLIRRHPHVFGEEAKLGNAVAVLKRWDEIKAAEKQNAPAATGPFKHLPPQLPALLYAGHVFKQIEKNELPAAGIVDDAAIEELAATLDEPGAGRALFALAAACRRKGLDPEDALRRETS
ncbi:MAG: MazG family protein, partial [Opitutales bacterium]